MIDVNFHVFSSCYPEIVLMQVAGLKHLVFKYNRTSIIRTSIIRTVQLTVLLEYFDLKCMFY